MGRADSLAKLAWAYGLHLARRRLTRPRSQLTTLIETYAPDGIRPLTAAEREIHPRLVGCINCGQALGEILQHRLPAFSPLDEHGQIVRAGAQRIVQRTILLEPAAPLEEFLSARLVLPEIRRRDTRFD